VNFLALDTNENRPNFISVKTAGPKEAVSLLLERFPMVLDLGESREELEDTGPFYAYNQFASEVQKRVNDEDFLKAVCTFMDELAASNDPLLENLLTVSVLENSPKIRLWPRKSQFRSMKGQEAS
jgi:hypothetical protein